MAPTEELTEYERERLAKIERNKALMERLALAKLASEAGWGRERERARKRSRSRSRSRARTRARTAREASAGENVVSSGEIEERVEVDVVERNEDRATVEDALFCGGGRGRVVSGNGDGGG